mmetsp:Transcript_49252/g.44082  ORF Transcript_49252/g.44082 Transcript_49252/m.44082 type:complete len:81 (-) Transcript_49252:186-428(-)
MNPKYAQNADNNPIRRNKNVWAVSSFSPPTVISEGVPNPFVSCLSSIKLILWCSTSNQKMKAMVNDNNNKKNDELNPVMT